MVSSGGNVTVGVGGTGNVVVWATTGQYVTGLLSATGNITGALVSATGNVDAAGNLLADGYASVTGNIQGGNLQTTGIISATGNITGNYFIGNGSQLTGVNTASNSISNGTSNVTVVSSGGNVAVGIGGVANIAVVSSNALSLANMVFYNNGNTISANYTLPTGTNNMLIGPITLNTGITLNVPSGTYLVIL